MSPPRTLTTEEQHALLQCLMPGPENRFEFAIKLRNYTLTLLMLETGLRVGEAVHLLIGDLWFADQAVNTLELRAEIAKTKQPRRIPVSTRLSLAITNLDARFWHPLHLGLDRPAFAAGVLFHALTPRQVQRFLQDAALKAGIRRVTPHMLRHTFATRCLSRTNTRITQILLGHASIQSTQIYTHPNDEEIRKAVEP